MKRSLQNISSQESKPLIGIDDEITHDRISRLVKKVLPCVYPTKIILVRSPEYCYHLCRVVTILPDFSGVAVRELIHDFPDAPVLNYAWDSVFLISEFQKKMSRNKEVDGLALWREGGKGQFMNRFYPAYISSFQYAAQDPKSTNIYSVFFHHDFERAQYTGKRDLYQHLPKTCTITGIAEPVPTVMPLRALGFDVDDCIAYYKEYLQVHQMLTQVKEQLRLQVAAESGMAEQLQEALEGSIIASSRSSFETQRKREKEHADSLRSTLVKASAKPVEKALFISTPYDDSIYRSNAPNLPQEPDTRAASDSSPPYPLTNLYHEYVGMHDNWSSRHAPVPYALSDNTDPMNADPSRKHTGNNEPVSVDNTLKSKPNKLTWCSVSEAICTNVVPPFVTMMELKGVVKETEKDLVQNDTNQFRKGLRLNGLRIWTEQPPDVPSFYAPVGTELHPDSLKSKSDMIMTNSMTHRRSDIEQYNIHQTKMLVPHTKRYTQHAAYLLRQHPSVMKKLQTMGIPCQSRFKNDSELTTSEKTDSSHPAPNETVSTGKNGNKKKKEKKENVMPSSNFLPIPYTHSMVPLPSLSSLVAIQTNLKQRQLIEEGGKNNSDNEGHSDSLTMDDFDTSDIDSSLAVPFAAPDYPVQTLPLQSISIASSTAIGNIVPPYLIGLPKHILQSCDVQHNELKPETSTNHRTNHGTNHGKLKNNNPPPPASFSVQMGSMLATEHSLNPTTTSTQHNHSLSCQHPTSITSNQHRSPSYPHVKTTSSKTQFKTANKRNVSYIKPTQTRKEIVAAPYISFF